MPDAASGRALAGLRRLKLAAPPAERCDLCAAKLQTRHKHFVECAPERVVCVCDMCALLLDGKDGGRYCRVSSEVRRVGGVRMTQPQWQALGIPVSLVFFYTTGDGSRTVGVYPSPAGPVKSEVDAEAWKTLVRENPELAAMRPYAEALLAHRTGDAEVYLVLPIDECYSLVGLVRRNWQGISGGAAVQEQIADWIGQACITPEP